MHLRLSWKARVEIAGVLTKILVTLYTWVLEECRMANIMCLFRKCSSNKPGNYKPVILTSVLVKLVIRRDSERRFCCASHSLIKIIIVN